MKINLANYRLHLVLCPIDMRRGFQSLSALADMALSVNVLEGRDCVIFVSKSRSLCKAIWSDDTGAMLLTRQLKNGRFAKLVARAQEGTSLLVSPQELEEFFSGEAIQHTPRSIF